MLDFGPGQGTRSACLATGGRGCHVRAPETLHVTCHGSAVEGGNVARPAAHQSALDGTEMRQKCALGRFRAEDQSVARRSWREGCGGAGFGENASCRGYRLFSMVYANCRRPPADQAMFQL